MKILKLRYKNINSLKGEHEINFSHACFKEGIFLITGVTGSGKSSLLDVISMALYAQTPRLKDSVSSLMTQSCQDSFCELFFEIKGEIYRSRFTQSKQEDLFVSEMELYIGSELITSGVTTVPSKVTSLIGLNFKQFMQTILLAQGSFDTFLKASIVERALILEKMTDTAVYAKISKHVFQRAKEEESNLLRMRDSLENVTLYDAERLEKLEQRQRHLIQEKSKFNVESLIHRLAQKKAFDDLKVKVEQYKKEIQSLEEELISHQDIEYRYQKFLSYFKAEQNKIAQVRLLDRELDFTEKNFSRVEQEFTKKEKILEGLKKNLEKNEVALSEIQVKKTHLTQELKSHVEGEHLRQNYTLIVSKIHELEKVKEALKEIKLETKTTLTEAPLRESIASLEKQRAEFEKLFKSYNLEQIEQQYLIVEKKANALIRKQTLEQETLKSEEEESLREGELLRLIERDKELHEKKEFLRLEIEELSVEQKTSEKIVDYEQDRTLLRENSPCPLCGSLEHPLFQKHIDLETLSTRLEEKKRDYSELKKAILEHQKEMNQWSVKLELIKVSLNKQRRDLTVLRDVKGDLSIMKKEKDQLNEQIQEIRYQKEEASQILLKLKEKEKALAELRLQIQRDKNRGDRESLLQSQQDELKYFLIKTLRIYGIDLDGQTLMILEKKRENYESLSKEMEKLAVEVHPLESENIQIKSKKSYLEESIQSDKKRISTQKCDILMLNQKRLSVLENQEIESYHAKLEEEEKKIRQEWDEYNQLKLQFNEKKSLYFSMMEEIEMKQSLKMFNFADLEKKKNEMIVKQDEIDKELASIRASLEEDTLKRQKFEQEEGSLDEQKLLEKQWRDLNALIGSEDGEKYRLFAQSCTLNILVGLSNKHLQKLNKRYLLSVKEENSLELEVVDLYQNKSKRAVVTLSSGESFIVSLALALGLSELFSNGIEIKTLFLDEGFETLDEESLEVVLRSLQNLEQDGRLIGIVSHVKALKEKIPNQIQMSKSENGLSSVSLVCG